NCAGVTPPLAPRPTTTSGRSRPTMLSSVRIVTPVLQGRLTAPLTETPGTSSFKYGWMSIMSESPTAVTGRPRWAAVVGGGGAVTAVVVGGGGAEAVVGAEGPGAASTGCSTRARVSAVALRFTAARPRPSRTMAASPGPRALNARQCRGRRRWSFSSNPNKRVTLGSVERGPAARAQEPAL